MGGILVIGSLGEGGWSSKLASSVKEERRGGLFVRPSFLSMIVVVVVC
jgi:hypothetical protein